MIRVALVGLGDAGYHLHLPALAGLPDVEVVGAADVSQERRDRAAGRSGLRVFAEFDDLLARTAPDVVIIATPPDSHADYCIRSFEAGAHVICEKPFASSVAEANRVLGAAERASRLVALNHEFREMPIFRAMRAEVARASAAGQRLAFAQVWQLMDQAPWTEAGWRGALRQRTLFEAGVHLIDFVIELFDEMPIAVTASMSAGGAVSGATDAIALATLEFSGGRLAQIVQNRLCKGERQYFEVRAELPSASLRASFGGRARISAGLHRSTRPHVRVDYGVSGVAWREIGAKREFLARNPRDPVMHATRDVVARSLAAFRDGSALPTTGERARDILRIIAASYTSAQTGSRVVLDGSYAELADLRMGAAAT